MSQTRCPTRRCAGWLCGLGLLAVATASGCQVDMGGQTLPSPYWLSDDVQYFAPGPEFKLAREAAAMSAAQQGQAPGGAGGATVVPPGPAVPAGVPLP